MSKKAESEL